VGCAGAPPVDQASLSIVSEGLVAVGLGVGILSESMTTQHEGDLARVPVTGIDAPAVLALVWKPAHNPALRELVRHCETAFAAPAPV